MTAVISQTAVLSALLYYFGWASTNALYGYFGVDASVLGLSVTDYLIRGARLAFPALLALGSCALFATYAHHLILGATDQRPDRLASILRWLRGLGGVLVPVGVVLVATAYDGDTFAQLGSLVAIFLGFALLAYSVILSARAGGRGPGAAWFTIMIVMALLSLFGALGTYAGIVGRQAAQQITAGLRAGSEVTVYSEQNLELAGPGVTASSQPSGGPYRYRYSGLHLLIRSAGLYLLVPTGWTPQHGEVIALPDDGGQELRIEFSRGAPVT